MRLIPFALALLAACSSCAHMANLRSSEDQFQALVKIETVCMGNHFGGSGVMVSDSEVVTAAHVVTCEMGAGITMPPESIIVWVTDADGVTAEVDALVPGADVARLHMKVAKPEYFTGVRIGAPPKIGDKVCEVSGIPRPTYRCGEAQPSEPGYIKLGFMVENGNSGSGLYNDHGELIGIVTNLLYCQHGQICAGKATALTGYAWLVP